MLLTVINNRLKTRAEEILAEEQAGFRSGRSTVEQIANVRILGEKYRNHQMEIHHNFIDFKKAFDRVWRAALWMVMKKHKLGNGITKVVETQYKGSSSAVLTKDDTLEWFETTVGVRQGCILSPSLFNIFLEQIMTDALSGFEGTVKIGGRSITNLRFADDIDLLAGSRSELEDLTKRLDTTARKYGMEISGEKSKIMITSKRKDNDDNREEIHVDDHTLDEVKSFQYLGSTITEDVSSETEIKKRLAMAIGQLAKLNKLWKSSNITTSTKVKLMRSLVISIALYGCETWTFSKKIEKRIMAFEMRCFRRILGITWKQRITNETVVQRITELIGAYETLIEIARRRKLQWFGHVTRRPGTLAHTIMHGSVEGKRTRGRPKHTWLDDITNWTGHSIVTNLRVAENRDNWKKRVMTSKCPNGRQAMGIT